MVPPTQVHTLRQLVIKQTVLAIMDFHPATNQVPRAKVLLL